MILLSDLICHDRASPFAPVRHAADRLRKPAQNHAPGDIATPALERFVFGRDEYEAIYGLALSMDKRKAAPNIKLPFPEFWLEVERESGRDGYLVELDDGYGGAVVSVFSYSRRAKFLSPVAQFRVLCDGDLDSSYVWLMAPLVVPEKDEAMVVKAHMVVFAGAITALTRTRMASTRRTHRYEGFPNIGVATRRAAQRGAPVYSFHIVKFAFPQVSIQRGETVQSVGDGVRGHWVIGHWRYIDKNTVEPHFTWVPAHKRGNEALGFITKQRSFNTTKHAVRGLPPGVKGAFGVAV